MLSTQEAVLKVINDCINACEHCYISCLRGEDATHMADCIITDRECADVCKLTAQFVATDSRNADKVLQLCRDICLQCEEICRQHPHEHCQKCADACHQCHIACDEYLKLTV